MDLNLIMRRIWNSVSAAAWYQQVSQHRNRFMDGRDVLPADEVSFAIFMLRLPARMYSMRLSTDGGFAAIFKRLLPGLLV